MRKAMDGLSRIQTELQYRREACTLTPEQEALVEKTPSELPTLCQFHKVMETVVRQKRALTPFAKNQSDKGTIAAIENFIAPPFSKTKPILWPAPPKKPNATQATTAFP